MRAPPQVAAAIETLDFGETLPVAINDPGFGGKDTGLVQRIERDMFGQKQIPPALADSAFLQLAELHDDMPGAIGRHGIGGEFWLG